MRKFIIRSIFVIFGAILFSQHAFSQKKLLILGSSTSSCFFGPSSFDSCYVTRLQKYYSDNGLQITVDNRAVAGDNCYQGMPLNSSVPAGRNSPRGYNNITEGLQGNPDVVLVNYPSNGYDEFSVDEVMNCLRTIKQTANNAGKECYITTTQPRQDPASFTTSSTRSKMLQIKERVMNEFGSYAINFWDGIANPADFTILNEYNADGIHLNNSGHRILFNRVLEKNIFRQAPPTTPVPPTNPEPPTNPVPPTAPTGQQGLNYRYYEGQWVSLPDFNTLNAVKAGASSNIDLSVRNANEFYGILWEGYINIPTAGIYTFEITSDDGSKMYFNTSYTASTSAFVNNDGLHEEKSSAASININTAGAYPVAFSYFQRGGGQTMKVFWSGPGFSRQQVPENVFSRNSSQNNPEPNPNPPATSGSLNYRYYEGQWLSLPDFNALSPVKSGTSSNLDLSVSNVSEHFGLLWEGYINIPATGTYTFEISSDDGSKMYFNSFYSSSANALINNDGLHEDRSSAASLNLNAGSYPVAFAYFQRGGGRTMKAYWSGPGFSRQPIPNEAFSGGTAPPPTSTNGSLKYRYYEGQWLTVPDFNAMSPVKSGSSSNIDISPRNSEEHFAFVWEGYIRLPQAGNYNFEIASDDGSNLYFNTFYSAGISPLVNNDGLHEEQYASGNVYVNSAGNYPVAITYFQRGGGHTMKVFWSGPGFSRQPIPDAAFSNNSTGAQSTLFNKETGKVAAENTKSVLNPLDRQTSIIYPNPFKESVKISYYNTDVKNNISAALYDLSGRLLFTRDYKNIPTGMNTLQLNLKQHNIVPGKMYVVKLHVNGKAEKTFKIMRE